MMYFLKLVPQVETAALAVLRRQSLLTPAHVSTAGLLGFPKNGPLNLSPHSTARKYTTMRFLLIVLLWECPRNTYPEPDGLGLGVSVPRLVNYLITAQEVVHRHSRQLFVFPMQGALTCNRTWICERP